MFCQAIGAIIWKHSCDCFKPSLRQKRIDHPDNTVFYPCVPIAWLTVLWQRLSWRQRQLYGNKALEVRKQRRSRYRSTEAAQVTVSNWKHLLAVYAWPPKHRNDYPTLFEKFLDYQFRILNQILNVHCPRTVWQKKIAKSSNPRTGRGLTPGSIFWLAVRDHTNCAILAHTVLIVLRMNSFTSRADAQLDWMFSWLLWWPRCARH